MRELRAAKRDREPEDRPRQEKTQQHMHPSRGFGPCLVERLRFAYYPGKGELESRQKGDVRKATPLQVCQEPGATGLTLTWRAPICRWAVTAAGIAVGVAWDWLVHFQGVLVVGFAVHVPVVPALEKSAS